MCVRPTLTLFPACSHPAYDTDGLTHWIADAMVLYMLTGGPGPLSTTTS